MSFFRSSKTVLGLDIGSHSVKAVQLLKKGRSPIRLTSLGMAEIDQTSADPTNAIISAINSISEDCDFKKSHLITSLGGSSLVIKQVSFPSSSRKEIESSLKWEAGQYIPLPIDQVALRFQIVKISKDEKNSEVLLVAVNKESLQNHLSLLSQVNLQPKIVDANPLALANAFLTLTSDHEDKNIAMIEIGAGTTVITIFRKGGLFFTRDISIGGNRFTREIQTQYKMGYLEAENFKKEKNPDLDLMKSVLNELLLELRQSLLFYDTRTGNKEYEEIILTGGGSKLSGFSSYLEENLNLPIVNFNPLDSIKIDESFSGKGVEKSAPYLGVAMGLALRG